MVEKVGTFDEYNIPRAFTIAMKNQELKRITQFQHETEEPRARWNATGTVKMFV